MTFCRRRLIGRHNAANSLAVVAACCELGVDYSGVHRAFKHGHGAPGRLQYVRGSRQRLVYLWTMRTLMMPWKTY